MPGSRALVEVLRCSEDLVWTDVENDKAMRCQDEPAIICFSTRCGESVLSRIVKLFSEVGIEVTC